MSSMILLSRLKDSLGLRRNIVVMLAATLILGMGEELWVRFVPKYLDVLGAGAWCIGAYGALKDFLDAVYQYPGGCLADRLGRRRALVRCRRGSRSHVCGLDREREGSMHDTRRSSKR